jgi:hypothetical protein
MVKEPVMMPNRDTTVWGTSIKHDVKSYRTRESGPQPSASLQKGCRAVDGESIAAMEVLGTNTAERRKCRVLDDTQRSLAEA